MSKIVLWVSDMDAQIDFYANLLGLKVEMLNDGFAALSSETNTLLLHELPIDYRAAVPIVSQLPALEEVAIKPVFLVDNIAVARGAVEGSLATFPRDQLVHGSSTYLDVIDPEGNVIQIEQKLPSKT